MSSKKACFGGWIIEEPLLIILASSENYLNLLRTPLRRDNSGGGGYISLLAALRKSTHYAPFPPKNATGGPLGAIVHMAQVAKKRYTYESFYGSPRNVSLTESAVLEPGPGRISWSTVSLDAPTSSIDRPLGTQENIWIPCFQLHPSLLCRAAMERSFVEEHRWWWGGGLS